jgi:glutathione S-transferase
MKLYYSPGACSLAPHIALEESGLPYTTKRVDLKTHKLADGTDYYTINPKGYVPLLELDDGSRLSEVGVIAQYIADRKPGALAPGFGGMDRYRLMEWLNFIATELHKQLSPLWYPTTPEATQEAQRAKLATRFELVAQTLAAQPYLMGGQFTIADAYLYTLLRWTGHLKVDIAKWPVLSEYMERIAVRPAVQAVLVAEGLAKPKHEATPA